MAVIETAFPLTADDRVEMRPLNEDESRAWELLQKFSLPGEIELVPVAFDEPEY